MRLFDFRREDTNDVARVRATVAWEDSDRPPREVWVEAAPGIGPALAADLDGFAIAAAVTAQHHGERRLLVEGTLCPRLAEGLTAATRLLARWFPPAAAPPAIESSGGAAARFPPSLPRAAVFLSGGIDSLFSVAQNRDRYPPDHPASFRDAIVVEGYILDSAASPRGLDYWRRTHRTTSQFARAAGLEPIYVRTNLRVLEEEIGFFTMKSHSAVLASIAHLLSRRISSASIAADLDVPRLRPIGSHPLLDVLYSGSAVAILHEGIETSRAAKAARVAAWPEALSSVMVCTEGPLASGALNCGRCEKCLRTLAALGPRAAASASFDRSTVTPRILRRVRARLHPWAVAGFWSELAETYRARGENDLADAAAHVVVRARKAEKWGLDRGWKGALRRIDRRFFGGALLRASRRLRDGA